MDIHTLNSAEIKEFGSLYQEKLKQEYELIDLYNTLESNYKKRKNVKNMSKKRLAEMWATFVDTREKKIEAEMEAARSERILEKLQERGDELGVLIEDGWVPRVKQMHRHVRRFIRYELGIPEMVVWTVLILLVSSVYFYYFC